MFRYSQSGFIIFQEGGLMEVSDLAKVIERSNDKTKIIINNKGFGDKGLIYIIDNCQDLVDLCIIRNNISERGILHLADSPWKNLQFINLSYNPITSKGCKLLSRGQWDHLQILGLAGNQFGQDHRYSIANEGLTHISKSRWPNLTMLKISQAGIGPGGVRSLAKSNWPKLRLLDASKDYGILR